MKWNRLLLSLIIIIAVYVLTHIISLLSYFDLILVSLIVFFDNTRDEHIFLFLIPLSLFNDFSLGLYFGTTALVFICIFILKLMVTDNMYFKSDFLKFMYYFVAVVLYSFVVNVTVGNMYIFLIFLPLHLFFDVGLIYLINSWLESRCAV